MSDASDKRPSPRPDDKLRVINSKDIFQGEREVLVIHGDATYRFQITRQGKLILNK